MSGVKRICFGIQPLALLLLFSTWACASAGGQASLGADGEEEIPQVGPPRGALVLAGGGELAPSIWRRFVELAGGRRSRIVVLPTATTDEDIASGVTAVSQLRSAGAGEVLVLHTRDRTVADSEAFASTLRRATGVWFPGGRQWRLVDAYLHTRTHRELFNLLNRGGVVGGTSAGASIQASYLARGDPATNRILMAPNYEEGFGFLSNVAVDQHLLARNRQNDMWELIRARPEILGIGVDEGTAVLVRGNRAEVLGRSGVAIYNGLGNVGRPLLLREGDVYDLGHRLVVAGRALEHLDSEVDSDLDLSEIRW